MARTDVRPQKGGNSRLGVPRCSLGIDALIETGNE